VGGVGPPRTGELELTGGELVRGVPSGVTLGMELDGGTELELDGGTVVGLLFGLELVGTTATGRLLGDGVVVGTGGALVGLLTAAGLLDVGTATGVVVLTTVTTDGPGVGVSPSWFSATPDVRSPAAHPVMVAPKHATKTLGSVISGSLTLRCAGRTTSISSVRDSRGYLMPLRYLTGVG
jgi:hypothetical protein